MNKRVIYSALISSSMAVATPFLKSSSMRWKDQPRLRAYKPTWRKRLQQLQNESFAVSRIYVHLGDLGRCRRSRSMACTSPATRDPLRSSATRNPRRTNHTCPPAIHLRSRLRDMQNMAWHTPRCQIRAKCTSCNSRGSPCLYAWPKTEMASAFMNASSRGCQISAADQGDGEEKKAKQEHQLRLASRFTLSKHWHVSACHTPAHQPCSHQAVHDTTAQQPAALPALGTALSRTTPGSLSSGGQVRLSAA